VVVKRFIFWDVTPCRPGNVFQAGFLLGLFFDHEMEAKYSSETSVDIQQTARRYIPEEGLILDCCEHGNELSGSI
jgi:hypothetical protein